MFPDSVLTHKWENGCFERITLSCKILWEIKKIESGNNHIVERGFPKWNFARFDLSEVKCPGDIGNPDDLWMHSKGGFETTIKKSVKSMETCLAANRRYFEKENVKYTPKKVRMIWVNRVFVNFLFRFYGGVQATVFTKSAVTRDLFYVQTLVGACWKGNSLQNTCALLEFK